MAKKIVGIGHHPFSKKYEFKGFFDDVSPCLIATDYKAPKCILEYHDNETEEIGMNNAKPTQKVYEKKSFTYASAFAGIGGMTLGLKPLGGEGVIAWEYDPTEKRTQYAQEAHRLLHPEIPVQGDICEADTANMPDFDLLCFTPPCQAFSVAGKRGGFEDTRGTLTFEALRIAKDKRPKALFMENVKGIVNHDKGDTMSTIIHAINEIGYTVDFTVLNSKYFDVAQNRERVYLIGIRDDLITPEPWADVKGTTMLPKAKRRYQEEGAKTFNFDWPEQTEVRTRLRDFLEDNVDEKYYLSEDKTEKLVAQLNTNEELTRSMPLNVLSRGVETKFDDTAYCIKAGRQQELLEPKIEVIGKLELSPNERTNRVYSIDGLSPTPAGIGQGGGTEPKIAVLDGLPIKEATTKGYAVAAEGDAVNIQFPNSKTRRGRVGKQMANTIEASGVNQGVVERTDRPHRNSSLANSVHSTEGISSTLDTMQGGGREPKILEESPIMLGHIDLKGHDAIKRVYSPTGQGPTGQGPTGQGPTLTTIGGGHREPKIAEQTEGPRYRIRKLTPKECLRLQSVPEDTINVILTHFSDSRAYKFAGNGLTTNVIAAIGERLLPYLDEEKGGA